MYLLALQITGIANPAIFKYRTLKDASREFERVSKAIGPSDGANSGQGEFMTITDDYGHSRALWGHHIQHPALIDMERDIEVQAEMALWQARGQTKANQKIQNDPRLNLTAGAGQMIRPPFNQ
jgi:hypothetical protein